MAHHTIYNLCAGNYGPYGTHHGTHMNDDSTGVNDAKIDRNLLGNLSSTDWYEDISQHRKKRIRQKIGSPGTGKDILVMCTTTLYFGKIQQRNPFFLFL